MITTVIECTECHDLVDIAADSVSLPFVCPSCDNVAKAEEQFTKQKYVDMAPSSVKATASTVTEPTEEFATVENTTLLIEDLESQVRDLQERNVQQANDIDLLNVCIDVEENRVVARDTQIANQAGTIKNREQQNDELLGRSIIQRLTIVELARMVKFLKAEVAVEKNRAEIISAGLQSSQSKVMSLEREKIALAEKIVRLEDENKRKEFGLNYWNRVCEDEKAKSLWQCFKDRYFDKVTENAGYAG
jgi:hypothetical protein